MRAYQPMTASVEVVTPQMASKMLAGNAGNRPLRRSVVRQMAEDMRAGRWQITHQGVAIAPDGRLLDGQHRLSGIVEAGVPVALTVARNVPAEAFGVMDGAGASAGKRTLRDVTRIDGRVLDPCSFLARIHGVPKVTAFHAERMMPTVGEAVESLLAVAGSTAKARTAAPIKAAAALRLMQGHGDHVRHQWRALVSLRYEEMTPSVQALVRQITDARAPAGGAGVQYDRAARAWVAFDPRRAHISKIQISDIAGIMQEMRQAWTPPWASANGTAA
jgi:hypothetical protein